MPNLYGWLLDDSDTFARAQHFESGGFSYYDIPWFHAYMWLIALPVWRMGLAIPSFPAPHAWRATPEFRALIAATIFLHGIVLVLLAIFLKQLVSKSSIAFCAFLLVLTSPTLALYTPLLDSRYLGFLAALPAMMLLLHGNGELGPDRSDWHTFLSYFLPGLLFGVGEDIHYECLYMVVPFSVIYWIMRLREAPASTVELRNLGIFVAGLATWIVPVQLLSQVFQPFEKSYVGTLLFQYRQQINPYSHFENWITWIRIFVSEMGVPLMIAVVLGSITVAFERFRPPYVSAFNARLMAWSVLAFSFYIAVSPTHPFYRMSFGFQFFYAILAVIFLDALTTRIADKKTTMRRFLLVVGVVTIAFVPTFVRSPEVFAAQEGFGRAVILANRLAGPRNVRYIVTFDLDGNLEEVTSRRSFEQMRSSAYLVTYFPETFHFKYPDLFALLYDTKPIASFPTLWCTAEMWAEVPTFFGGRRWSDEPQNCEAFVYRVSDLKRSERGRSLEIESVESDGPSLPTLGPERAFAIRQPGMAWYGAELWHPYWDLWLSSPDRGRHWLDVNFTKPARIDQITIVPPEFRIPPDFLWRGRIRVENVEILGSDGHMPLRSLWLGKHLQNQAIFTASFAPVNVSHLRFVLWQTGPANAAVGIKFIRFPGYRQTTSWQNVDTPGHPPPGR